MTLTFGGVVQQLLDGGERRREGNLASGHQGRASRMPSLLWAWTVT